MAPYRVPADTFLPHVCAVILQTEINVPADKRMFLPLADMEDHFIHTAGITSSKGRFAQSVLGNQQRSPVQYLLHLRHACQEVFPAVSMPGSHVLIPRREIKYQSRIIFQFFPDGVGYRIHYPHGIQRPCEST